MSSSALGQFKEDITSILGDWETNNNDKYFRILGALSEYKKALPSDYIEADMVWIIYQNHGDYEGDSIFAICSTEEKAESARVEVAAKRHIMISQLKTKEIAFDAVHLDTIFIQDNSFDIKTSLNSKNMEDKKNAES